MLPFKWNLSSSALCKVIFISLSFWRQFTFRIVCQKFTLAMVTCQKVNSKVLFVYWNFNILIQLNNIFALWLPSWLSISSPCCHTRMKPPEFSCLQFPPRHSKPITFLKSRKTLMFRKTCSWLIVPTLYRHSRVARATEIRSSWEVSEVEKYLKL